MVTIVSRESSYDPEGRKLCSRCRRRPARKRQRYCNLCFAEYGRERRAGKVQVLLTPEEWEFIKDARRAEARGRHHASSVE